jgi:uncharacterized membrane protein
MPSSLLTLIFAVAFLAVALVALLFSSKQRWEISKHLKTIATICGAACILVYVLQGQYFYAALWCVTVGLMASSTRTEWRLAARARQTREPRE